MTGDQISSCLIKRVEFKTKPCSQNRNRQHDIELTSIRSHFDDKNPFPNKFEISVENFHFLIDLDYGSKFSLSNRHIELVTRTLNNSESYYDAGYKLTSVDIGNIFLNLETRTIAANSLLSHFGPVSEHGLGMQHHKSLTFVEYLSIAGQLTQMLLYKLENITREESNNMWVRSLTANFHNERTNQSDEVFSMAHFSEYNMVTIKNENWRTVTAKFEIGNIEGFAKVCHII